jgi:hypothetical protein
MAVKNLIIAKPIKKIKIKLSNTNILVPVQIKSETKLLKKLFNKKKFLKATKDVGKIISVKDGVVRVSGLFKVLSGEMLHLGVLKIKGMVLNVIFFNFKKYFYTLLLQFLSLFHLILKKIKKFFLNFSTNLYLFLISLYLKKIYFFEGLISAAVVKSTVIVIGCFYFYLVLKGSNEATYINDMLIEKKRFALEQLPRLLEKQAIAEKAVADAIYAVKQAELADIGAALAEVHADLSILEAEDRLIQTRRTLQKAESILNLAKVHYRDTLNNVNSF